MADASAGAASDSGDNAGATECGYCFVIAVAAT
jgi:hypothetical protein